MKNPLLLLIIALFFFFNSCQKENNVKSEYSLTEEALVAEAKNWINRMPRGADPTDGIDFLDLNPDWNKFRVSKNLSGEPQISIPLVPKSTGEPFFSEISVVVDITGKTHGILKVFKYNPYYSDTPMKIYTRDGRIIAEGLYLHKRRALQLDARHSADSKVQHLSYNKDSAKATLKKASGPIRVIEEVVIMPPEQPDNPNNGGGAGGVYYPNPGGHSGGGGGSGPGGVSVSPPETSYEPWEDDTYNNREIIDSLQGYPCAQDILQQLPNLKNQISAWLVSEFGGVENDLLFRAITTLPDTIDGYWNTNNQIGTMQTITLNGNMLKSASKEYILVTMYHEALHAYIYLEKTRLAPEVFFAKYSEWSEIDLYGAPKFMTSHAQFRNLMTHLKSAIKNYNANISDYDAEVLAKSGVVSSMSNFDININKMYKNGNSGTKCSN